MAWKDKILEDISDYAKQAADKENRSGSDIIFENFKANSILSGTARDDIEYFVDTQVPRDLADYAGGERGFEEFVTGRDTRNEFFRNQAKEYNRKDKTGDPMARLLNALYGRGDFEGIDRVADVIAERLRPRVTKLQTERNLKDLMDGAPKPPTTVTLDDKSAKAGTAATNQNKRRGASLLSSVRAGETGNVSGRKSNVNQPTGLLGSTKDVLGAIS